MLNLFQANTHDLYSHKRINKQPIYTFIAPLSALDYPPFFFLVLRAEFEEAGPTPLAPDDA